MINYKAWYDPQENKYYLKIDGEEKQEITKTQFDLWTDNKPISLSIKDNKPNRATRRKQNKSKPIYRGKTTLKLR